MRVWNAYRDTERAIENLLRIRRETGSIPDLTEADIFAVRCARHVRRLHEQIVAEAPELFQMIPG